MDDVELDADDIDYERIHEILVKTADFLSDLGFDNVRGDIESRSAIGRAVSNPRSGSDLITINRYLLELKKNTAAELKQNPQSAAIKRAAFVIAEAVKALAKCVRD